MRPVLLCLCLSIFTSDAVANPLFELTGSPEPSRPFSGRSASNGPITTYFNPGRLSSKRTVFELSYQTLTSRLSVTRSPRPTGYDVPSSVYGARIEREGALEQLPFRPFATADLPSDHPLEMATESTQHMLIFGAVIPVVKDLLSVGVSGSMTFGYLQTQRPFYVDERAQFFDDALHFELMGDRLEATNVSVAIAYHPVSQLSIGIGGSLLNSSTSVPEIYVPDAGDQEQAETNPQIEVIPTFAPHFGVVYRPWSDDSLEVSSAMHLPSQATLTGRGELRFWDFEYPEGATELDQPFDLTFQDEPLRVSLGLKTVLPLSGNKTFELYGDAHWAEWSNYTDRHGGTPADWTDTLSGRLGARFGLGSHAIGLGFSFVPTPVSEQSGRTNYVDNTRLGAQAGWVKSWSLESAKISVGLGLQLQSFLDRAHYKSSTAETPILDEFPDAVDLQTGEAISESAGVQTNNPGFPHFEHGGWTLSTLLTLRLER